MTSEFMPEMTGIELGGGCYYRTIARGGQLGRSTRCLRLILVG